MDYERKTSKVFGFKGAWEHTYSHWLEVFRPKRFSHASPKIISKDLSTKQKIRHPQAVHNILWQTTFSANEIKTCLYECLRMSV